MVFKIVSWKKLYDKREKEWKLSIGISGANRKCHTIAILTVTNENEI